MIRIMRVVICTEKNGESTKVLSDEYPNEVTSLSLEEYKTKIRIERRLSSHVLIDVMYMEV